MPVTHLVNVILRPGIQSIQVQYKYQSAEVWTNYSEGQRIPGGVDVKFIVTTYSNFTLTEWNAYYSDEYDDTVNIPLTSIQGESAWTFTLPSADVYIRCEADSRTESSVVFPPDGITVGSIVDFATAKECFDYLVRTYSLADVPGLFEYLREKFPNQESVIDNMFNRKHFIYVIIRTNGHYPDSPGSTFYSIQISVANESPTLPIPINSFLSNKTSPTFFCVYNITDGTWRENSGLPSFYPNGSNDRYRAVSEFVSNEAGQTNPLLTEHTPGAINSSIRYIMSPENSGEVDASAPSEFVAGTTEFTFKWKVKAAYEFRRLTPFAVGEGSLEDDIVYSLDSYDGDTRTYTFTVTQIPDWAIGVRVLIETIYVPDDQNASGTNTSDGPIGGDGTFDDTSDEVPLPAIPTGISAADSGLVTLFRPTIQQVKELGNYLWSNLDEFWENLQKIFTNPMDYIIGLNTFPVNPSVDAARNIYIGNWLTNISMPPVRNQFYEFDCGIVNIREYFGSFLDYASNTRARIMLPFIGDRDLNINEIMNKTLRLWYRINLLSGECLAALTIDNSVYYQWNGNCAIPIPLTGSDWSRLYGGIGRIAGTAVGFALGGLAGATTLSISHMTAAGMLRNAPGLMGMHISEPAPQPITMAPGMVPYGSIPTPGPSPSLFDPPMITETFGLSRPARAALQAGTAAIIGHNVMGASPRVAHSGDMSGGIGIMGNRTPYIFLEYPNVNMPENYKHIYGYPSNQYAVLGNLAGYTQCKTVMFESTTATDDEVALIMETLKSGVYL